MVLEISQDELDDIWNDANKLFDEMETDREIQPEIEYDDLISKINPINCEHTYISIDTRTHEKVCEACGVIVENSEPVQQEWNNYKDDCGNYSKNTQRGDTWVSDNPYEIQCTMFRFGQFGNKRSLLFKLQQQICFNHKQKNIWQVRKLYEHVAGLMNLRPGIVSTANLLWCACVDANILTRAEVRTGLIAICFYYACLENNIVMERSNISKYFECKNLSKGEKVFCSIVENIPSFRNITQKKIDPKENSSFIYYCNKLDLEFKVAIQCEDEFERVKHKLKGVTPKSAIAGVISFIVKDKLKFKHPSKKEIGEVVNVCIPTLNKVIGIIKDNQPI